MDMCPWKKSANIMDVDVEAIMYMSSPTLNIILVGRESVRFFELSKKKFRCFTRTKRRHAPNSKSD